MKRMLSLLLCLMLCLTLIPAGAARAEDGVPLEEITDEGLIEILDGTEDDEIIIVDEEDAPTDFDSREDELVIEKEDLGFEVLHIDPLYRSVITEEQLAARLEAVGASADAELQAEANEGGSFETMDQAAAYLKSRMLSRDETVVFTVPDSALTTIDRHTYDRIIDAATAYSDSCSGQEGDALRWGFIGWGAERSYDYTTGERRTKITFTFLWSTTMQQEYTLSSWVDGVKWKFTSGEAEDRILAIHDYICDRVDYDTEHVDEGADYPLQFSAYAAMCQGKAVCQGYAILFYRLAKEAGLSVRVITSTDHAWNIVRIGDVYYNIDTTWDGESAETTHDWYLLGMRDFSNYHHIREEPFCSDEFEAAFPMVKDSRWDLANLSCSFKNVDGGTVSSTASSKPKLLIFDQIGDNSGMRSFLYDFLNYDLSGVNVLLIDVFKQSKYSVDNTRKIVTGTNARFCYDTGDGAYDSLFAYMDRMGYTSRPVVSPVFVFIDSSNKIQNYRVGLQGPATIAKLVKESLGVTLGCGSPRISEQPEDKALHYNSGETVRVTFSAEGVGLGTISYQWYYRTSSTGSWNKCSSGGYNQQSYSVEATKGRSGYQYRCAVKNPYGTTYTNTATLKVIDPPKITAQPSNATVRIGDTASFTVQAVGAPGETLRYQWYYRKPVSPFSSDTWYGCSGSSAKTATLSFEVGEEQDGYEYRCHVTDSIGGYLYTETVTLRLAGPTITAQPDNQYGPAGSTVCFTVGSDNADSYQWYFRTSSSGAWNKCSSGGYNTASYAVTVTSARDGYQYRCRLTNADGSVYTRPATLTLMDPPVITSQPQDATVSLEETAYFMVTAENATSYRWYRRSSSGAEWEETYNGSQNINCWADEDSEGTQFYCIVSNATGSVDSEIATLCLNAYKAPYMTLQPVSVTAVGGETARFFLQAKGGGLSYQWQYRTGSSGSWNSCSGGTKAELTVEARGFRDGYEYRCKVTNKQGTVYTQAAALTVTPGVTQQPADQTAASGETASFTVKAEGATGYQWQYRTSASGGWNNCSGGTSATLTVEAKGFRDGYQYRCKLTNKHGTAYSDAAALHVKPGVTTQPADRTIAAGSTASFTVKADGKNLSYQWQYRTSASGGWNNCSGGTEATLTVEAKAFRDGYQYRCKVSNASGYACSEAATLKVKPGVTTQPADKTIAAGSTASFSVKAEGKGLSYQWYYRTSASGAWNQCSGGTAATLKVEAKPFRDGYQYRCKVSNANGYAYSEPATLKVKPGVTAQPTDQTAPAGTTAQFTVRAAGNGLSYQWYYRTSASGAWNQCTGGTAATLSVEAKAFRSGYQYRCKVSNANGYVYTNPATLTVS